MIYLELLLGFLKVGLFAFGGAYAAIPFIREVVLSYGWIGDEMLSYMIAVSESTPGPVMVNLATYVGSSQDGLPGAIIATFAVVLPAFIITVLIYVILKKYLKNYYVSTTLDSLKCSITGVIIGTGLYLLIQNIGISVGRFQIDIRALIISLLLVLCVVIYKKVKKKLINTIALIGISAVLGMIVYGVK